MLQVLRTIQNYLKDWLRCLQASASCIVFHPPVFHVSLLKPAPPASVVVSTDLPDTDDGLQIPERVLQRRLHQRGNTSVQQLLIRWSGLGDDLATWEDADYIMQYFHAAPAWGQAGTQGGGVSVSLIQETLQHLPRPRKEEGPRLPMCAWLGQNGPVRPVK